MINLIPKEEKKKMVADFYYRLAILSVFTLGFCVLAALLSILPSYFVSSARDSLISARLADQRSGQSIMEEELFALHKHVDSELDLVEKFEKNKFFPSVQVINATLLKKRLDIKITRILYENDGTGGRKISLAGTAPSREVLLLFRRALEDDPAFKDVVLPISNFVKGSDINFFMTLNSSQQILR